MTRDRRSNHQMPYRIRWGLFRLSHISVTHLCHTSLVTHLWDERLSSVAAHEMLDESGHDKRDRKQVIDQVAAVVILRGWMEAKEEAAARPDRDV